MREQGGRESALSNLKLILNCERHHAASSSAFDGRKNQLLLFLFRTCFPPAVKQIRQSSRRSCSWCNIRGKGQPNCWLEELRGMRHVSPACSCPAPDNASLASSKTGTHGGLHDSLRPLVLTLVCLHSALGMWGPGGGWDGLLA